MKFCIFILLDMICWFAVPYERRHWPDQSWAWILPGSGYVLLIQDIRGDLPTSRPKP